MFDVGFSELVVIALVALIAIGPERLPRVARTAGVLLGRLQRYVNQVKSDIDRELRLEELKQLQRDMERQAREIGGSVSAELGSVESELKRSISPPAEPPGEPLAEPPAGAEPARGGPAPAIFHPAAAVPPTDGAAAANSGESSVTSRV